MVSPSTPCLRVLLGVEPWEAVAGESGLPNPLSTCAGDQRRRSLSQCSGFQIQASDTPRNPNSDPKPQMTNPEGTAKHKGRRMPASESRSETRNLTPLYSRHTASETSMQAWYELSLRRSEPLIQACITAQRIGLTI